ncbi:MAG: ferritin [Flammeovirgaceae bacterium]|nr:ferritin [Flammeovirgaceae bacterium]
MKAILTKKTSLIKEIEGKLNEQIRLEGTSSQYYLSAASWCEKEGYQNSAEFLYTHAEEERMHMMKIFRYVNASGGYAIAPEITDIKTDFHNLREVFELTLEHEIAVSIAINNLVDYCFKAKDFASFQFLQWYVAEQREEEELSRRVIEIFDIIGEEGQGLWMIDQEIAKVSGGTGGVIDPPPAI